MVKYFLIGLISLGWLAGQTWAYGPDGHRIVGAIADERLIDTPTGEKIRVLLDGISLRDAAVLPDQIKRWDRDGPDNPKSFHLPDHPKIEEQLVAFWKANPPSETPRSTDDSDAMPSHHWFHYTDVPVKNPQKYADGKTGRSKWDIVHMIPYCLKVLQGGISEENERAITKPVAVILLAHYVGDLHQPLHVGAQFFDAAGQPVDPDAKLPPGQKPAPFFEDQGGNTLLLTLKKPENPEEVRRRTRLHSYWDSRTVNTAWVLLEKEAGTPGSAAKPLDIIHFLASREPANWKPTDDLETTAYAEVWANEMLPQAREAHARLDFVNITSKEEHGEMIASGSAVEARSPDGKSYRDWAGLAVRNNLQKAGWRLADLLQKAVP